MYPLSTGSKLNVPETFGKRPVSLLNVLCALNLLYVPKELSIYGNILLRQNPKYYRVLCVMVLLETDFSNNCISRFNTTKSIRPKKKKKWVFELSSPRLSAPSAHKILTSLNCI